MSKENLILLIFLFIGALYLLWIIFQLLQKNFCNKRVEHFTTIEPEPEAKSEHVVKDEEYNSRMDVIKVFDTVLHRKPTSEEIEKYSVIENEQDLLVKILSDFKVSDTQTQAEESFTTQEALISNITTVVEKDSKISHKTRIHDNLAKITAAVDEINKALNG